MWRYLIIIFLINAKIFSKSINQIFKKAIKLKIINFKSQPFHNRLAFWGFTTHQISIILTIRNQSQSTNIIQQQHSSTSYPLHHHHHHLPNRTFFHFLQPTRAANDGTLQLGDSAYSLLTKMILIKELTAGYRKI